MTTPLGPCLLEGPTEEQLRLQVAMLTAVANGVFITDRRGDILWANPAFTALTGYTLNEVRGQNPRLLKSGRQDSRFYRELWQTITAGKVWQGELVNRRKDGSLYDEEMTITPVRDSAGLISHFIAIKQDITQRKRLEAQYRQAQKMEAVGRLAGGVAHDFNNLLTIINGYSDILLARMRPDDPLREMLNEVRQAGERASSLTRQLLAFSRKQIAAPVPLDLKKLVDELRKMLSRLIGEDVRLEVLLCPEDALIKADPGQVEQMLLNLVVNARDAMPQGGRLEIETSCVELTEEFARHHPGAQPGPHVLLRISDTGCGMTPEVQARIFEPFFTTKEPGKGTGLGLATVYGIVQQTDAHLEVESEPGRGTTFRIWFPRLGAKPPGAKSSPRLACIPHGTETILLVEDQPEVRALARLALAACGYTILEAGCGPDALALLQRHQGPLDLLMTDMIMPRMTGRELADRLLTQWPGLKVLFFSGYTADAIMRQGVLEQGLPFLQKPFTLSALARKVREVLDTAPRCLTPPPAERDAPCVC
jgi:two-component system cell cycle sensor histidine kinase/response regulator CckA